MSLFPADLRLTWSRGATRTALSSSVLPCNSRNGILTGRYEGRQCVLTEKARLVRERYDLATYPTIYAYGDTPEDLDMLAIATKQYYQWQEVGVAGGR
ncbi:haloacid dehalogenase-like hydrolase [Escherichia coli]